MNACRPAGDQLGGCSSEQHVGVPSGKAECLIEADCALVGRIHVEHRLAQPEGSQVVKAGQGKRLAESGSSEARIDAHDVDLTECWVRMTSTGVATVNFCPVETHHVVVLPCGKESRCGEPWFAQPTLKVIRDPSALIGKVGKGSGVQIEPCAIICARTKGSKLDVAGEIWPR